MADQSPPSLQDWIVHWHRFAVGMERDDTRYGVRTAFTDDPAMLAAARTELDRLTAGGERRTLAEHDHESKIRADALRAMLAYFDEGSA